MFRRLDTHTAIYQNCFTSTINLFKENCYHPQRFSKYSRQYDVPYGGGTKYFTATKLSLSLIKQNATKVNTEADLELHWGFPSRSGRYGQDKLYLCRELNPESSVVHLVPESRDAQIPGARSPLGMNFVRWRLMFVVVSMVLPFMSPFWGLEFWGRFFKSLRTFEKSAHLCPSHYVTRLSQHLQSLYGSNEQWPPTSRGRGRQNCNKQATTDNLNFIFLWSMFVCPIRCSHRLPWHRNFQ